MTSSGCTLATSNPGRRTAGDTARRGDPGLPNLGAKRAAVPSARRGPRPVEPGAPGREDSRARSALVVAKPRGRIWVGEGSDLNLSLYGVFRSPQKTSKKAAIWRPKLSEPVLALFFPQSCLLAEDQAAGGGVAPPSVSLPPPMGARARLQTIGTLTPGGHLPSPKDWWGSRSLVLGGGGWGALLQGVLEASRIGQPRAAPRRAVLLGSEPLRGAWEGRQKSK